MTQGQAIARFTKLYSRLGLASPEESQPRPDQMNQPSSTSPRYNAQLLILATWGYNMDLSIFLSNLLRESHNQKNDGNLTNPMKESPSALTAVSQIHISRQEQWKRCIFSCKLHSQFPSNLNRSNAFLLELILQQIVSVTLGHLCLERC